MEGRGPPPLTGAIQGKIAIDQYDLEKAQMEDGSISLVKSWFNKNTGRVDDKSIDTNEFETLHSDVLQLYKVRITDKKVTKQARLLYLLEDEFETNPIMRMHMNTGECNKLCNR